MGLRESASPWNLLEMQISMSYPSSAKLKTLNFNKRDLDACLNMRPTGLKQKKVDNT